MAGGLCLGCGHIRRRAHKSHVQTAGGHAAQLRQGSAVIGVAIGAVIEVADNVHIRGSDRRILKERVLLCQKLRLHHICRDVDTGKLHGGAGDACFRVGSAVDRHCELTVHGYRAGSADTCLSLGADGGIRHVGFRAGGVRFHAAHGLGGLGSRFRDIGVGDIQRLYVDYRAGGVDKRLEVALGLCHDDGDTGSHIARLYIRILHAGIGDAVGLGLYRQSLLACLHAGSGHGSFVCGIVLRKGDVAAKTVLGDLDCNRLTIFAFYADWCGVGECCLGALALAVVEEGLHGDRRVIDRHAV